MTGDSYTLYQAAFLIEICFKDSHEVNGLFDKNKAFWSLKVE